MRVGHRVPLAGFCLSLYGLHVLNRDVYMVQTIKPILNAVHWHGSELYPLSTHASFMDKEKHAAETTFPFPVVNSMLLGHCYHGQWSRHWWFASTVNHQGALIHVGNSLANCMSLTCSSQCCRLVQQRPCHVLSCICGNACKRSLAICHKCRALQARIKLEWSSQVS